MNSTVIRHKLYDYIRIATDKKLIAIYNLLEDEIVDLNEWWKNKKMVEDFDNRYNAMETGEDKGVTIQESNSFIEKSRVKKYGK